MGAAAKQVPRVFARAFSPRGSNKIIYDSTIRDILSATRSSLLEKVLLPARVIANPYNYQTWVILTCRTSVPTNSFLT